MPADFVRYLSAKKSVDDRALNGHVWQTVWSHMPAATAARPWRVLEIGAGIGTMVERLHERGVLTHARYTAIDVAPDNVVAARRRLARLPPSIELALEAIDLVDFAARERGQRRWQLLLAHAFLDLVDVPATLPLLFDLLEPGGLFYFTLNFDGGTILQPPIEAAFDARVEALYHETMDRRLVDGRPSGDSQTGRRLLQHIPAAGGEILAAGSSDWVVFAGPSGYPADEATFLRFIIQTMAGALAGHPGLDLARLAGWIRQRQAQIAAGELIYIAHQLDVAGRLPVAPE